MKMAIEYTNIKVFKAVDLWADPVYSISKLFDGFDTKNFPISCFLNWQVPTDDEILDMDDWSQDEVKQLRDQLISDTDTKIGESVMIFIQGTL